ncbi:hypothetical protein HNY73_011524, partial [Argiope bruennichi]
MSRHEEQFAQCQRLTDPSPTNSNTYKRADSFTDSQLKMLKRAPQGKETQEIIHQKIDDFQANRQERDRLI